MFKIPGDEGAREWAATATGNICVKTDTLTQGSAGANLNKMLPGTLYFDIHAADATDLLEHKNYTGTIPCRLKRTSGEYSNLGFPGSKPAMGGMTNDVLEIMWTDGTVITLNGTTYGKDQYVYQFNYNPVVSTYSYKNNFSATNALPPGTAANPMKLSTIGDCEGTDWSWQIVSKSNAEVATRGPYSGQDLVPHVQSASNNGQVQLIPIRAAVYCDYGGARAYLNIQAANATYAKVPKDLGWEQNGIQVTVSETHVCIYMSMSQFIAIDSQCSDIPCWDQKIKNFTWEHLKIVLQGNSINHTTTIPNGRKVR
jgi:hypothetical protein